MKNRYITYLLVFIFTFSSNYIFSQVVIPNGILFQAVARDANNNAASNRNIYAIVNILEKTTNGNSVFSESFKVVSSQEGIFTIVIGQGTRLSGVNSLTDISWTKNLHFVNIKIAIEPTLYNPDWSPSSNYVDIGTSQLWAVPYSLSAANANFADSATTITTILPSTKGGTGVNNNGKNITIANNITTKGIGDLTITTTGASNITFPTDGLLANTKFVSDRIGADTISLSNRINALSVSSGNSAALKLNISDTASMLSNRIGRDTISLSNRISRDSILISQNKQAIIDTAAAIRLKLNDKIEVAQFPNLIQPFLANTIFSFQDTMTLSNRIDKKLNISDTAGMLSSYVNLTRPQSLFNKSINGVTPTSLANGFTISGGTNTTTTVTVVGDVTIGGVNSGDQLITLTGDVSGSGTGSFPATVNSIGGVSSSTIATLPTSVSNNTANILLRAPLASPSLTGIPTAPTAATGTISTQLATTEFVANSINFSATPDADALTKGKLKLTGDLSGTADVPLVSKIGGKSISLGGSLLTANDFSVAGNYSTTLTSIGNTNITLPTSGTLATLTGTENLTNKRINGLTPTALATGFTIAGGTNTTTTLTVIGDVTIGGVNSGDQLITLTGDVTGSGTGTFSTTISNGSIDDSKISSSANISDTKLATISTSGKVLNSATTATNLNTLNSIVSRDGLGNFNAGTITASLAGNASTTTALQNPRNIFGFSFDGTSDLNQVVSGAFGGTGVSNGNKTITLGGNINTGGLFTTASDFVVAGNYSTTLTATANTNITLPITGTLATLDGSETLTNKILMTPTITSPTGLVKADVGLGNVDNTSDLNKPISNLTQIALDAKANTASPTFTGTVSGITKAMVGLGNVDNTSDLNKPISIAVQNALDLKQDILNEKADINSPTFTGTVSGITKAMIGLGNVDNTSDLNKPISTATQTALDLKEALANKSLDVSLDASSDIKYPSVKAIKDYVDNTIINNRTGDATNLAKGILKLTGDLSGTADVPLVSKIGGKSISLGGSFLTANDFSIAGNFSTTLTSTGNTNITLPTTGTIATLAGTESLTNKTINGLTPTALSTGFTIAGGTNTSTTLTVIGDVTVGGVNSGDQLITLTGDVTGSGTGTFSTTINSIGGVSSSTISNLPTRLTTAESNIVSNTASITTSETNIATNTLNISSNTASITAEITRALAAESALDTRVSSNTASITTNIADIALRATLASPSFTGTPTAPTAAVGTNTTQVATTEFVLASITNSVTPDADALTKGKLKLAGDLSGTADVPLVSKIGGKSISLGGNFLTANDFSIAGNYSTTLTSTGNTNITLPTTGTLATLSGTESLTNKTINGLTPTALSTGFTIAGGTSTSTTLTVIGDVTVGGVNSGDQLITLTGDVTGSGTGTFSTTINSIGGVSSSTISNLPRRLTTAESNIVSNTASITTSETNIATNTLNISSNTASITAEITRALAAESALDTRVSSNTASITTNIADIALRATIASPSFTGTPTAPTAAVGTNTTQVATTEFVLASITNSVTPDADALTKGKLQLSNDLGGTASAPTVNSVGGVSSSTIGTIATTIAAATDANTVNTLVLRDGSGNFAAGMITANVTGALTGNASTATKLATTRSIYGNNFDGSAALTQAIGGTYGGTGVNNGSKTITLGGNINTGGLLTTAGDFVVSGNYSTTLTATANTNVTLPTTGTLATLTGSETLTNKTLTSPVINSPTGIVKADVGLGNVDNTSDANKPVSTAQQTALDLKEALANKSTDLSADAASNTKYPSAKAVADYVSNSVSSGATPDATSTTKGKLQLSNDLGGTASAPTVNSVGGVSSSTIGTIATTIAAATDANTVNTLVLRDGSGNFAAGMITANVTGALTGNASTATKLATTRSIYGNNFDGSAALTQAIGGTYGGTGVNNGSKTITLGGNINTGGLLTTAGDFVVAGNYSTTLTATANTNVTLPTTGTLATLTGSETLTNKTLTSPVINSPTGIVKADVGLGNVDNTSDANKPVSTAQQTALDLKEALANKSTDLSADAASNTKYPSAKAVADYVSNSVSSGATPDATSTTKGKLQLSNDLGGTASAPTVNSVGGVSSSTIGTIATTIAAATSSNTVNTLVKRDANGAFSAGEISASFFVKNGGVSTEFLKADGSVDANDYATTAQLAALAGGTFSSNQITGIIAPTNGGTGVNNGTKTITLGGNLVTSGAYNTTLTATANTNVTLPTTGTIATLAGTETLTNKTLTSPVINSPTGLVKADVGLGNVDNTSDANKPVSSAQQTALDLKANLASPTFTGTVSGITKTMVGLGNVDNTSDANKPVSNAQQTALDLKEALANKSTDLSADAASNTKYPSAKAVADYVSNSVSSGATPDATSTTKGKLQLSNDLGGTASAPTVNSVGGVSSSTIGTIATTIAAATDANTVNTLVLRDGSGNFAAGMITANVTGALTGNASTATKLATTRSIYGNNFDGSAALTQAIGGTYGGTGVNNGSKTITLGGNINTGGLLTTAGDFVVAGNYSTTLTATANTNVTLPTTGTLATLTGSETLTNKTLTSPVINSPTGIVKADVGLGNVDNTSDANKPVSTAQQTALDLKEALANKSTDLSADAASNTKYPSAKAVADYVSNSVSSGATPDATSTTKGKLQLSNDLGGTAAAPTVNSVGGVSSSTIMTMSTTLAAATDANTVSTLVLRDGSGNFAAGMITANVTGALTGNASTATKLATVRNIFGNSFDGSADISGQLSPAYGGTGVNNGSNTLTLGGSMTTVGSDALTLTISGTTSLILPSSGTLSTLGGDETFTGLKLFNDQKIALKGSSTGKTILSSANSSGSDYTITIPAITATIATLSGTESLTNKTIVSPVILNPTGIVKSDVGLGNVNNTSDADKPVSTAQQTALDLKENLSNKSTSVTTDGASDSKYPSAKAVKTYVDAQIASSTVNDATTSAKGIIKLGGDLAGTGTTAAAPIITDGAIITAKLADDAVTTAKVLDGAIATSKLADGAVTNAKITSMSATKLTGVVSSSNGGAGTLNGILQADGNGNVSVATLGSDYIDQPTLNTSLSSYLPLTGGTLTGALNGTTANFTNGLTVNGISFPSSDGTTGQLLVTNGSGTLSWSSGALSVGAIAGSSNAKGALISSNVLSLTPADVTNGGIVTTLSQTFAGAKTFSATTTISDVTDATSTSDGALIVAGGASIAKNLFIGGLTSSKAVFTDANKGLTSSGVLGIDQGGTGAATKVNAFNALSPMTTAGDLIYGGTSGSGTRLAIGSANTILRSDGSAPVWGSVVLTTDVTGVLPVSNGGTGSSTQNFVDLTTSQTIAGSKTFSGTTIVNGSLTVSGANVFTAGGTTFPTATGTTGQVLTISAGGSATWTSSTGTSVRDVTDETGVAGFAAATAGQTSFTLSQLPNANSKVKMYINGVRISNNAYSVNYSTKVVTYTPANNGTYAIIVGDRIQFDYFY